MGVDPEVKNDRRKSQVAAEGLPESQVETDAAVEQFTEQTLTIRTHVPVGLRLQELHPDAQRVDERGFLIHDASRGDVGYYEKQMAVERAAIGPEIFSLAFATEERRFLIDLCRSLGRSPTPAEIRREYNRQRLFRQVGRDLGISYPEIRAAEEVPQRAVMEARKNDFPASADEFEHGKARIEIKDGITRLIISTSTADGRTFDHPVMTTEEFESWVKPSARMLASALRDRENPTVFVAGLGLGLLNKELARLGISKQVVAELNHDVIRLIGSELQELNPDLKIRQGDFKKVLREAIESGERFDAISIDAFPNSAEEVNRDASSNEVLALALKALKPGGILTFYPDSRYIPARILKALQEEGIPLTSIHYTMGKFEVSEFTQAYHYGALMSVPAVQKPLLEADQVAKLEAEYWKNRDEILEKYAARHLSPDGSVPSSGSVAA